MRGVLFGLVKMGVAEGVRYLSQGKKYCLKCNGMGSGCTFGVGPVCGGLVCGLDNSLLDSWLEGSFGY